jgi:hypothetical protein
MASTTIAAASGARTKSSFAVLLAGAARQTLKMP